MSLMRRNHKKMRRESDIAAPTSDVVTATGSDRPKAPDSFRGKFRKCLSLVRGAPAMTLKLLRLLFFVVLLLPAFVVFAWYYASCDRVCVPYGRDGDTSGRRRLDVYGSATPAPWCGPTRSDGTKKPVVVFLTGGGWVIGYKMWGALLARALVPFGILVVIPDYRNFPQCSISKMVDDVDDSIQWVFDNCGERLFIFFFTENVTTCSSRVVLHCHVFGADNKKKSTPH